MPTRRPNRRFHWSAEADRLERRITPALPIVGPWSPEQHDQADRLAATNWTALATLPAAPPALSPFTQIASFQPLTLDIDALTARLGRAPAEVNLASARTSSFQIALPAPDGAFHRFSVVEVATMEPGLAAMFPDFKTYRGQGIDDPTASLAMDVTLHGFHASVLTSGGSWYIDPYYHLDQSVYASYFRGDVTQKHEFVCYTGVTGNGCGCAACAAAGMDAAAKFTDSVVVSPDPGAGGFGGGGGGGGSGGGGPVVQVANGTVLRTYRTAIAGTGEYTQFHGGSVAGGQAAIVTTVNRLNQVYERDFAVRMVLVENNNLLVFTNAGSDPYSNGNSFAMLAQNQQTLDSIIGTENYDLGHVYGTGGGGVAGDLGIVGVPGLKGQGVSLATPPVADPFVIDYVAHEIGHQFGGRHTFSSCGGSTGDNPIYAFEPGSGTSIMAYAGICGPNENVQNSSDAMFHSGSLDLITDYITNSTFGKGHTVTPTGNNLPEVSAGPDYTIPAGTPFALTAVAFDPDGDALTYSWEQRDAGAGQIANEPDTGKGPLFRTYNPSTSPTRYFPQLSGVLAGTATKGETLPTTNRVLNFRAVVRDNRAGGGGANDDDVKLTVVKTATPFAVTAPNTATTLWTAGNANTVTWNVAGTDANGIDSQIVTISLSLDGGTTWQTLIANTPNDGSHAVNIPNTPSTTARVKVEAADNIFYDVSDANFTIKAGSGMAVISTFPAAGATAGSPVETLDLTFSLPVNAASIGTNDLTLSKGTITKAQLSGANTVRYTLADVTGTGPWAVNLAAGAVASTSGAATGSAVFEYNLEPGATEFPLPLTPVGPPGSLIYAGTAGDVIGLPGDTDGFTIELEAGQTAVVQVTPSAGLQPTLALTGPGEVNTNVTATAPGTAVALAPVAITQTGKYTITVGGAGATLGDFAVTLELNTGVEAEPNDTPAKAQPLAAAFDLGGGATRTALRGRTDQPGDLLPLELEPNNGTSNANNATKNFQAFTGNLYQLGVTANVTPATDVDFFNIGALQVGDVITVTQSGLHSARGALADAEVFLLRDNNGQATVVAQDDEGGPGPDNGSGDDALIHRFTIAANDTYYIRAQSYQGTAAGSYQLSAWLENAGAPPLTGGGLIAETEANNTAGTASNFSTSWRAVNYQATTGGTVSAAFDVDFFRYTLATGDRVSFVATPSKGSTLDARLNLRNSSGAVIASEDGTSTGPGGESAIYGFRVPASGTYFVEVASAANTSGAYTLNGYLSAGTAPPSGVVPFDYYSVPLTAGQAVEAVLDWDGGELELAITDAAGDVLANGFAASSFGAIAQYTADTAGTYLVRVGGSPFTNYLVAATAGATWEREPNTSFATGQPLTGGRVLGVQTGDDDWYRFEAAAGQTINLSTLTPGGGPGEFTNAIDPRLDLFSPANVLLAGDDNSAGDGRNAKLSFVATATGSYGVRVRGVGGSTGEYVLAQSIIDTPPTITEITVNGGAAQRSRVTEIAVTFSEPVTATGAFQLTRAGGGAVDLTATKAGSTVTLTFGGSQTEFASLIDGNYTFTVFGAKVVDAGNLPLGQDATVNLFRLFGDADGSRAVDFADFLAFRAAFGSTGPNPPYTNTFDFNNDNAVNFTDFLAFRSRFGTTLAP